MMRPLIYTVISSLLIARGFAGGASDIYEATDKEATAYCHYVNQGENEIRIDFNLALGNDPNERLIALNQNEYYDNALVEFVSVSCDISYIANNRVYHVQNTQNLNSGIGDDNLCGMQLISVPGAAWAYRVLYLHQTGRREMIEGKDRVYVVECTSETIVDPFLTAEVTVARPGAIPVDINDRKPTLSLWRLKDGVFQKVVNGVAIEIGTQVLLQLEYRYESQSTATYYGAAGFYTIDSRLPTYANPIELLDNQGCEEDQLAAGIGGFRKYNDGSTMPVGERVFTTRTDPFSIWAWENPSPQFHYIKVYYDLCHIRNGFNADQMCEDTCLYSQTLGRRRREVEQQLNSTVLRIEVYDPNSTGNDGLFGSESNKGLMIGAIIGAIVLCAIFALILALIVCRRRRSSAGRKEKIAPQFFENPIQTKY